MLAPARLPDDLEDAGLAHFPEEPALAWKMPPTARYHRGEPRMPEISRFFGIVIRMFFNDHAPAHFHAIYGNHEALIEIETLAVYRGDLPRRAMALVLEWAMLHRQELRHDWELVTTGQTPAGVEPLD